MLFLGVDGCRGGWVVAGVDGDLSGSVHFSLVDDLADLFRLARLGRASIVIDIPIGLPAHGVRACDVAARRFLARPHAPSVFNAPARAALAAVGVRPLPPGRDRERAYRQACRLNEHASGLRLSRQSFHLLPRIAEVDRRISPSLQTRVHEGHPEVVFQILAGRRLHTRKRTPAGLSERLGLLNAAGLMFEVPAVRERLGRDAVAADDVVDAAACAVAARRVTEGDALILPRRLDERVRDPRRLRMEIVA
jgi:predicted RNase H-like nuclease